MSIRGVVAGFGAAVAVVGLVVPVVGVAEPGPSGLDRMDAAVREAAGVAAAAPEKKARVSSLRGDGRGRVVVYVEGDNVDTLRKVVAEAGGEVSDADRRTVRAAVPPKALEKVAGSAGVVGVRRPETPVELEVISEGVQPSGALAWHGAGKQGAGVKVGIIDRGFGRLDEAQANNEVPTNTVVFNGLCGTEHGSSHGTTVAEVVHDMAPQAQLYLACVTDSMDFDDAARWLKDQGVAVVNVSLGFPGTGRGSGVADPSQAEWTPATTVAWLRDNRIVVVAAAGNEADKHMTGPTADPDNNGWMNISGASEGQGFTIAAGAEVTVNLQWDAWPKTTDDLDLYVMDVAAKPTGLNDPHLGNRYSLRPQKTTSGGLSPVETLVFTNTQPVAQTYWIYAKSNGIRPTLRYDLTVYGPASGFSYVNAAGSIAEPASSPAVLAVGAITPANAASGGVEPYSSRGPTIDGRIKPDITGFTNVSTHTGGVVPNATKGGTSIAAAHVTGAAALYKGANTGLDPAELEALLLDSSSRSGRGNDLGYGVLNAGSPRVPQPPAGSAFTPLQTYRRVLNTSDGTGKSGPFGPEEIFTLRIDGLPEDVSAVVLNLTGRSATEPTSIDAFATKHTGASTLPVNPNAAASVMAVVTLDPQDKVLKIRNAAGQVHLIADLVGYFSTSSAATYTAAQRPVRLAAASPILQAGQANTWTLPVRGVSGISPNATAVMVSVTATEATAATHIRVSAREGSPAWTFSPTTGELITYTYLVPIAEDGAIRVSNDVGAIKLAVDVVGWFAPGDGARYVPLRYTEPVANSKEGTGMAAQAFSNVESRPVRVTARPRIPYTATGAVLSLSAPQADTRRDLSVWATEHGWSGAASLSTEKAADSPTRRWSPTSNAVVTPLGASGTITVQSSSGSRQPSDAGSTHIVTDITGYFVGGSAAPPAPMPSLRGHWKFNEGAGTTTADSSGNNHPATLRNGVGWTPGVESSSGAFDGVDSYAATTSPVIRTDQSFSVSAWARLTDSTDWRNLVSQDGGTVSAFYLEYLKGHNKWGFGVAPADTAGVQPHFAVSTVQPQLNVWTHLVGVYDASARQIRLYVNGELEGSVSNVSAFNATGALNIGRFKWASEAFGAYFAGGIDDVRVYQLSLSGTQVRDLYAAFPLAPRLTTPVKSFLEITNTGELMRWTQRDNGGYLADFRDPNWGGTNLIANLPYEDFLEIKNGELVEWVRNGKSWTRISRDTGWGNARLITALDHDRFLLVRSDGALVEWRWTNAGYRPIQRDTGWGATRHIAGLCGGNFVEIKGTELAEWQRNPTGGFTRAPRDTGWADARLVAGLNCSSFVEVKDSGELFEWNWSGSGFSPTRRDTGWGNARLLG